MMDFVIVSILLSALWFVNWERGLVDMRVVMVMLVGVVTGRMV